MWPGKGWLEVVKLKHASTFNVFTLVLMSRGGMGMGSRKHIYAATAIAGTAIAAKFLQATDILLESFRLEMFFWKA